MDPDRVRSYLQVACAGLGFDIGEVWWMSNESGTSSVAAIEERGNEHDNNHNESDSSGEGTYANLMSNAPLSSSSSSSPSSPMEGKKNRGPKKRFLQLYTSKAYCNQRSKLVQPHDNPNETSTNDGHDEDGTNADMNGSDSGGNSNSAALGPLVLRNNNNNNNTHNAITNINNNDNSILDEDEHVLSPRIVEAVTLSAQVVWANCQKQEGLLGRSDIKLQTAIGMPVGVDDTGNVWVVVMFSPKNVESTSDAIDYLQYISRSAASCSIPCLLPVIHHPGLDGGGTTIPGGATKMICDGRESESEDKEEKDDGNANGNHHGQQSQQQHHHQSLVPIQSKIQPVDHTQELGEGVIAQFVSFRLNDEDENDASLSAGMDMDLAMSTPTLTSKRSPLVAVPEHDLRNAPKDDFGIPMLPDAAQVGNNGEGSATMNNNQGNNSQHHILTTQMQQQQNQQQQQQQQQTILFDSVSDAFDEASYGVWSTIMNSASGDTIRTSGAIASKMHLIQERLEEFANAFLGMSVFDVADAWITSISSPEATNSTDIGDGIVVCHATPKLKCLFTVAANEMNNENVHLFREVSANASIEFGDGAVGKAFSSGYPVWSSNKVTITILHWRLYAILFAFYGVVFRV